MSFDRNLFASKVRRYREQFQLSVPELASRCGIPENRVAALEGGAAEPTGDEVLILSDVFRCDYRFFISNETAAPFEETEELFRRHGDKLSREDRWAIQEFLYLCECEAFLLDELERPRARPFEFTPHGKYFKGHAAQAAKAFRAYLGLVPRSDVTDVFGLLRRAGLRVFRRALDNSDISGLFINHPIAGPCILVNYTEDVWRQRFTALHEACHAFLDRGDRVVVSFDKWDPKDLVEIRADTFAAHVLLPDDLMDQLPRDVEWTAERVTDFAKRLKVTHAPLIYRLKDTNRIGGLEVGQLRRTARVPREAKTDPELPANLTDAQRRRRLALLRRGLSVHYVGLCFEAFDAGHITRGRLAEMLLTTDAGVVEVGAEFGRVS